MAFVTRETLKSLRRRFVDVDLSKHLGEGQTMRVWNLTARDRLFYTTSLVVNPGTPEARIDVTGARTRLLLLTLGDEQGKRLYQEGDEAEIEALDPEVFDTLSAAADELTGMHASEDEVRQLFRQRLN